MSPCWKRVLWSALLIGIVCGLLVCGAPHHVFHADDGGAACFSCGLAGLEAPPAIDFGGLLPFRCEPLAAPRERAFRSTPIRLRSSRAPPLCV